MKWILFILCFMVVAAASAESYYADLSLVVDEKGTTTLQGPTNYVPLNISSSEKFTMKKEAYWTFNITTNSTFSDYVLTLELPAGAEINYMKSSGSLRLLNDNGLKIIVSGSHIPIVLIVQYELKPAKGNSAFYIIGSIILGLLIILSFVLTYKKLKTPLPLDIAQFQKRPDAIKIHTIKKTLTESQATILNLLLEAKVPLTQKQLQHRSKLPKATLSRNIDILEKKNILTKQSRGLTNVIFIHDDMLK
jgi:uncharacterized membrane protein